MNREYVEFFINSFTNDTPLHEVSITLKNGSIILIDTDIDNIEYGYTTITITDLFNENNFIQFNYESIKEINIKGNQEDE